LEQELVTAQVEIDSRNSSLVFPQVLQSFMVYKSNFYESLKDAHEQVEATYSEVKRLEENALEKENRMKK
jgi:hypothetical protein